MGPRQLRLVRLVQIVPMFTLNNDEYDARPESFLSNFGVTTDGRLHFFPLFVSGGSFSEREQLGDQPDGQLRSGTGGYVR
jgi:hypothetical protein